MLIVRLIPVFTNVIYKALLHRWYTNRNKQLFDENFCCCNPVVSDLCNSKSQNKITVTFFPNFHGCSPHFTVHVSFYFLQSISLFSSTIVHLIHIYHIWLHSDYIAIQPYCQFHFSLKPVSGNQQPRSVLDKVLILDR